MRSYCSGTDPVTAILTAILGQGIWPRLPAGRWVISNIFSHAVTLPQAKWSGATHVRLVDFPTLTQWLTQQLITDYLHPISVRPVASVSFKNMRMWRILFDQHFVFGFGSLVKVAFGQKAKLASFWVTAASSRLTSNDAIDDFAQGKLLYCNLIFQWAWFSSGTHSEALKVVETLTDENDHLSFDAMRTDLTVLSSWKEVLLTTGVEKVQWFARRMWHVVDDNCIFTLCLNCTVRLRAYLHFSSDTWKQPQKHPSYFQDFYILAAHWCLGCINVQPRQVELQSDCIKVYFVVTTAKSSVVMLLYYFTGFNFFYLFF